MAALKQEIDLLRGAGQEIDLRGAGGFGMPALDHEVSAEDAAKLSAPQQQLSEPELPSGIDELESAQQKLLEEHERQRQLREREGREGLQAELAKHEGEAREERQQLLAYLEQLRGRDDEAGSEIRGQEFGWRVEQMATEEQSRRGVAEAQQGMAHLLAITADPQLREQLLEVQRLDDLLAHKTEDQPPPPEPAAEAAASAAGGGAGASCGSEGSSLSVGGASNLAGGASGVRPAPRATTSRLSAFDLERLDRLMEEDEALEGPAAGLEKDKKDATRPLAARVSPYEAPAAPAHGLGAPPWQRRGSPSWLRVLLRCPRQEMRSSLRG